MPIAHCVLRSMPNDIEARIVVRPVWIRSTADRSDRITHLTQTPSSEYLAVEHYFSPEFT